MIKQLTCADGRFGCQLAFKTRSRRFADDEVIEFAAEFHDAAVRAQFDFAVFQRWLGTSFLLFAPFHSIPNSKHDSRQIYQWIINRQKNLPH